MTIGALTKLAIEVDNLLNLQNPTGSLGVGYNASTVGATLDLIQQSLDEIGQGFLGDYTNNNPLTITTRSEVFTQDGEYWRASPSLILPYTTLGDWAIDQANFDAAGEGSLRVDLATPIDPSKGAAAISRNGQVVESIAGLRTLLKTTPSKHAFVIGYYAAGDGGGGAYALDATDTTSTDNGGTVIVAEDGGRWKLMVRGVISFLQFGAVNNSAVNSTSQCQAATSYAIATGISLDVTGNFGITTLALDGASGLRIVGRGSVVAAAAVATTSLVTAKNVLNIAIEGAWFINGNYNTNYTQGMWIHTDAVGQAAAYLDFTNLSIVNCKLAYKIGNELRPDDLVSEINIRGGMTSGCPSVVYAVGAQTVVNFTGCTLASLIGDGNAGWAALPQKTVVARGATVTINGGELLHVLLSTGGSGTDFNTLCEVQTIDSPISGHIYGNINVCGALVESAARLASTSNPTGLSSPLVGLVKMTGCHGVHTQNAFPFVESDATFVGRLEFKANNFFCTTPRTQPNIQCGALCHVFVDAESFGENFLGMLSGVVGGILHFSHRMVLNVSNLSGQSIANGSNTDLKFTSVVNTGDMARFSSNYSAATGVFTVPAGGLKNIQITAQLLKAGLTGEWYVQVNNSSQGVRTLGSYNHNSYSIDSLNANDTIKVVTLNTGGVLTAGSANTDWFQIFASN